VGVFLTLKMTGKQACDMHVKYIKLFKVINNMRRSKARNKNYKYAMPDTRGS
jgi:hypothetical protein